MAERRATTTDQSLAQVIADHIGENVHLCYQCVKCSSGCPLAEHMDLNPNQVLRLAQLGDDSVLESKTIWVCASCQTCTTRSRMGSTSQPSWTNCASRPSGVASRPPFRTWTSSHASS